MAVIFYEFVRVGSLGGTPTSPNSGECFVVGGSGQFPLSSNVGFDISASGLAYMTANIGGSTFFVVDLLTGHATPVGAIGGNLPVIGIAVAPVPEPGTTALLVSACIMIVCWHRRSKARARAA